MGRLQGVGDSVTPRVGWDEAVRGHGELEDHGSTAAGAGDGAGSRRQDSRYFKLP